MSIRARTSVHHLEQMQIGDGIEQLVNDLRRMYLCEAGASRDFVEQIATRKAGKKQNKKEE